MYYKAIPAGLPSPYDNLFCIVRGKRPPPPGGPFYLAADAEHQANYLNGLLDTRIAMAMTLGRHVYVRALQDPYEAWAEVLWSGAGTQRMALLDGQYLARIDQADEDSMFELTLWFRGARVGSPVLCQSEEEAKKRVLWVYALRGM